MKVNARIDNVLGDGIGYVELIEFMGGDKEVVDRARVCYQSAERSTAETDEKLLKKLVGSKPLHGTTMRGTVMTFDVVAPLFSIRQWVRHIVGHDYIGNDTYVVGGDTFDISGAYDEQSFRYTDKIRFYTPPSLDEKQALRWNLMLDYQRHFYEDLRKDGLPKQLARCALGPALYSQMTWTVNLQGLCDWGQKRLPGGGAQDETTKYAVAVMSLVEQYVAPQSVAFWKEQNQ